jgi:hypothetical protein
MVTPPSALARNASGSNLALDFFATAESPCASVADYIIAQSAPRRQACLGRSAPKNCKGPLRKRRFNKGFWRAGSGPMSTRLQSRRLLLCRGNRRFSGYVARQSQRPQPRGLFTRGQTGCLVFGRCFLTVQKPLLLFLENRFGSIACLMSVQRRYSFSGESTPQDRPSWGPDAVCGTGRRLPMCRCGLGRLNQRSSG